MGESMRGLVRSHYCAEVDESLAGRRVTVMGWTHKRRDLGQLIFIALRDRSGLVQAIVDGQENADIFRKAEQVRSEYVLAIAGTVRLRAEKDINPGMKTGRIEIMIEELRILSEAEVPPFSVLDEGVGNDLRLKYRYLDLRRPQLQNNLVIRHRISQAARNFLSDEGFIEVETPILTRSTPEGARDYLVPSRIYPGSFYALPQSPQIFKQLLMVSGVDKYFQIARCFRDEDLRADRQPEFTQIDIEMSFAGADEIMSVNERMICRIFKEVTGAEPETPFERITYKQAMERFGSDKPDMRFGMELHDISEIVAGSGFGVFESALKSGGSVRGIAARGCADMPRKKLDSLAEYAKTFGAKGLAWINYMADGEIKSSISKFFTAEKLRDIVGTFGAKPGDLALICADKNDAVFEALGALRVELARRLGLLKQGEFKFVWVTEFPLLEWNEEDRRFYAKHHPFTSAMEDDMPLLETDPGAVRAVAYDLALNGIELGGGSLRIFQRDVQKRMFEALGFSQESAQNQFGWMMDAFKYGAPPHGGIAFGLDRIAMLLTGSESIRDVIAFPKVKDASCPMSGAPGPVSGAQLAELGLAVRPPAVDPPANANGTVS